MRSEVINLGDKNFRLSPDKVEFINTLKTNFPDQSVFSKEDLDTLDYVPYWVKSKKYPFTNDTKTTFDLTPLINSNVVPMTTRAIPAKVQSNMPVAAQTESINILEDNVKIVPEKMTNYVPFGHFKDVKNIIKSKIFFPVFVTGLSGNGKTLMIEQA